ncbi:MULTISPECIES: MBL fold metallo-hydrolase [Oceanobacillus]|uniref:MBL fold metallo-hydrolase n=1 Tax=Oceanobacillus aidingensis TaxID=645964 RepID=A0ABV9JXX6_9BACI|nr:MBL fold metallo-hydrolase [Oceanobacillus oncorhynchi]MDM8100739.1 MBL fold metallo-hydrolase [Oceanobacillus oncorhynchi]UUI41403.1 MBL fold metallo-hydrolase [Oceanobacillus oncorhynchi]
MDQNLSYGADYKYIPATSVNSGAGTEVLSDIYCHTIQIVNICFVQDPETKSFVLIDAGMPKSADKIMAVTEERFGKNSRPKAIILTHGHFDHVGGLVNLVKHWNVPVYAHKLELPFLTGKKSYPEPDPSVEGGLVAKASSMFPNEPIDIGSSIAELPADGSVPEMPGWKWIHTPGHSPGHISLYRESDRILIAGDAFITVKQDSLYKVMVQDREIHGPPRYFTTDWEAAKKSVQTLEALKPAIAITGHGEPMYEEELSEGLKKLVKTFDQTAVPDFGRYVDDEQ